MRIFTHPTKKVIAAKKNCYPDASGTNITETIMEVQLQSLLDHTAKRLLRACYESFDRLTNKELENIT